MTRTAVTCSRARLSPVATSSERNEPSENRSSTGRTALPFARHSRSAPLAVGSGEQRVAGEPPVGQAEPPRWDGTSWTLDGARMPADTTAWISNGVEGLKPRPHYEVRTFRVRATRARLAVVGCRARSRATLPDPRWRGL